MKNSNTFYSNFKLNVKKEKGCSSTGGNSSYLTTGNCLGMCVECGASCCMDVGHRGPYFCFLCK